MSHAKEGLPKRHILNDSLYQSPQAPIEATVTTRLFGVKIREVLEPPYKWYKGKLDGTDQPRLDNKKGILYLRKERRPEFEFNGIITDHLPQEFTISSRVPGLRRTIFLNPKAK